MRIGFVIPWFAMNISGGAETELRGLVTHFHAAGMDLEVLTTCVQQFNSDWNVDYYKEGLSVEEGIPIRRFPVRQRDTAAFDAVNIRLMNNDMPLTDELEHTFIKECVNSPALYRYMKEHASEYDLYVFIPYMFGTTYYGVKACPRKSVLIPCLHEESYAHMRVFERCFRHLAGMIFLSEPEGELSERLYDLSRVDARVLGAGVDDIPEADEARFREKYKLEEPFVLYAGRKDAGKNVDVLVNYFAEYRRRHTTDLKLVLIGGGKVAIPSAQKEFILDLGFLPVQDKYDAYRAASVFCNPSPHESFSIVIMESWLAGRPVLVSDDCAVTKNFVKKAMGGLYFQNYHEFEGALQYLLDHPVTAAQMGENGKEFVKANFSWDVIVKKYMDYFAGLIKN